MIPLEITSARDDHDIQLTSTTTEASIRILNDARAYKLGTKEFGTGDDASDVGNLVAGKKGVGACASTTHGHKMGGSSPLVDTIDRFSFSSDADAADFGELSTTTQGGSGVEN